MTNNFQLKLLLLLLPGVVLYACKPAATAPSPAGKITITSFMQPVDSTLDAQPDAAAQAILDKYKPAMDALMNEVIGQSEVDMPVAGRPESLLSNFTADALLRIAEQQGWPADVSLYNFGGIRSSLAAGAVRLYDIYALYPFENDLVILTIQGRYLRELATLFAERNVQPMGNVRLAIAQKEVKSLRINNAEVDDEKMYRLITNSFVAEGGDGMEALLHAVAVERTGMTVRDGMIAYIKSLTAAGKPITATLDGRTVVNGELKMEN
ncbi:MAG: 5'-nucleotidase C-terminal domain-containing protein [Prevotellaceae bacterium]|jgi:2',3'-cyclic-nucleotide 2'-phosphodiesterase (5'-nucleotidase family)|nr:5'-nucleotidase C-terminal domain-containing protein [Prevotellaceae bacterium]